MTRQASRHFLRSIAIILLLPVLAPVALPPLASAQSAIERMDTRYFTIYYPQGEQETAEWYAEFIDDTNAVVSELLGSDPVMGITLRIYNTEAEYSLANPMAGEHPGIMAHADPAAMEIGVAVERLRLAPDELARESFRHEMTHIVAGQISGQNLPIGFQEGLAQYNELSRTRGQEVAEALRAAQANGRILLTWRELNDLWSFRYNMDVGYPQSYSMVAFLADRYGMGKLARFVGDLRYSQPGRGFGGRYRRTLESVYGKSIDALEEEWRAWLPGFIEGGWQQNLLSAQDLKVGIDLYDAGRFAEARDHFTMAERLYRDLGREDRVSEAASYLAGAEKALQAEEDADQARQALTLYDYSKARGEAAQAERAFNDLGLTARRDSAAETRALGEQGEAALAVLEQALQYRQRFNFPEARTAARQAGEAFAALGDTARVAEADSLLGDLQRWQLSAGMAVLGAGLLALLGGLFAAFRSRRPPATAAMALQEENTWL